MNLLYCLHLYASLVVLFCNRDVFSAPVYSVQSIEELVDGFRRQQMVLSSTMLNESQNLGLPEKLAAAEVEEAEERTSTAQRGKMEAKTPFIATSSRLGLGYIGRGYDIYKGNPVSDDGDVDQGFRLSVIDLPFSFRFTSDGEYRIPDNVDVISETSASFGSSFHQVKTETDYQSMLMVDVSVSAKAGGWGASASFSASRSYQRQVKELTKGDTTTVDIVGRANVYKARMSSDGTMSKLSDFFEDAIRNIPSENCEETAMQQKYIEVVKQFGTHYTTEVVMGAKAVQEFRFRNSDLDRFQAHGVSVKVAAEVSAKFAGIGGEYSFGLGVASNQQLREMISNTEKEQREYYIGGSPPSGDYETGSTNSLKEWARSAAENPAPIQYKLSSIDELIKPEYFKQDIDRLYERRKCLRKALFTYCTNTVTAGYCGLIGETSSEGGPNTFKYGDFVTINSGDRFLALSHNYGISPGLTIRPLVSVAAITNYDGLFQIVPPEGVDDKLGSNIHYGEPFLLKTIEGEMLYMGKAMILNTKMYSEARLIDVFTNKDEEMSVNISHSAITDFSIFLRKEEVCSYIVSLRAQCWSLSTNKQYQVEMIGNKGTINGFVKVQCNCGRRSAYCHYPWHHAIVNEYDIGNIHRLRIMGLHGVTTDGIYEVRVKTLKNGEKRDIYWVKPHCSGRVSVIGQRPTTTKEIEQEVYPLQFTFHSTNTVNMQGQSVKVRDTGYIHILSSMPRKTYWGQGITQAVSLEDMGRIGIKEYGPKPHIPISTVCSGLIYPSTNQLSSRHDFEDQILISFHVNVMVNYIEMDTDGQHLHTDFEIQYVNAENETFMTFPPSDFVTINDTLINMTLTKSMYTTAIKIALRKSEDTNITSVIQMIVVGGCPSAVIDTEKIDTSNQEWKLQPSENEIQTSPYLKVVPKKSMEVDPIELFKRTEKPVSGSFTGIVQLSDSQTACNISSAFLKNYLSHDINTEVLKFDNIILMKRIVNGVSELEFTMDITAINLVEYERASMMLNSTIKMAIESFSCSTEVAPLSALQNSASSSETQTSSAVSSTGVIAGFAIVAVLIILVLVILIFRTYQEKVSLKEEPPKRSLTDVITNKGYNEYAVEEEDTGHSNELYINTLEADNR